VDQLYYGGDYNPEQWPEAVWTEDVALMRQANVNLVSVGVFAWARLEPAEGRYDFDWLDRVLELLHDNGIRVALATPTASPPPWLGRAYPETLTVTREGVRLGYGSRDTYCLSAPEYRAAARRIAGALAERYAGHPALAMWHVHNEYGTACYCDHAAAAFRRWLRHRYGDLEAVNDAWTGAFWSQLYGDWEEILPPRATQYLPNPTQVLDYKRFVCDELLTCFREQRDILHRAAPGVPATTNFALGQWVPVDTWSWSAEVDLVAIDCYPSATGVAGYEQAAFAADLARSAAAAGDRPWLLMEQSPGRPAGEITRLSLTHLARGCAGAMFFQWRASRGGAEQYHPGMVPHAGPDSRIFREVVELGALLRRLPPVGAAGGGGAAEPAEVALLWDPHCWWAFPTEAGLDYAEIVAAAHRALLRAGIAADFAHPEARLSGYRLVLAIGTYLVSDAAVESIREYVAGGGTLVVGPASGIVDPELRVRLGGYPGAFRDLLGVRFEELRPSTADTVVRHGYGRGVAWYTPRLADELLATIAAEAGVSPVLANLPPGVDARRRRAGAKSWLFLVNHTAEPAELPARGVDLVTGRTVDGTLRLEAGRYAVVEELV
jgi:beta-galactosidase